jgi:hypothetical protein
LLTFLLIFKITMTESTNLELFSPKHLPFMKGSHQIKE